MERNPCYHSKVLFGQSIVFGPFLPDMNKERGVAMDMYLKYSPDTSDSKYIWFVSPTP